jgi:cell division protein FtsB
MQSHSPPPAFPPRPEGSSPNITSAVGLAETAGQRRARQSLLFTRTVIWVTGLVCLAFLVGTVAQAWSNSILMQKVQTAQQQLQQVQHHHDDLANLARYYQDPFVIEREAREQLGYIRPGEHPVVMSSSPDQNTQSTSQQSQASSPGGFWQDWWNVFFGN